MALFVTEELCRIASERVETSGRFCIALSGGATPQRIYRSWASASCGRAGFWRKTHVFWGDERCVPPEHGESNFKMAEEACLSRIDIPRENIHRIKGENDPAHEARRYGREIRAHVAPGPGGVPRFDWILLGVGTDGHTASLFVDSPCLKKRKSICCVAERPGTGQKRITITLPLINAARRVTLIATGERKARIVQDILESGPSGRIYPAEMIRTVNGVLELYVDAAAAGGSKKD